MPMLWQHAGDSETRVLAAIISPVRPRRGDGSIFTVGIEFEASEFGARKTPGLEMETVSSKMIEEAHNEQELKICLVFALVERICRQN